ncbi:STAS domain-containing protein [Pulveribacter sp.]|uniref:STAS domain-containing protein n=1 Tax=Pulveribacter sp. TaxID=2678893 RepID=UPI0028A852D0|nr:STAS domain-containing protein [Pulveribacter sp.]
MIHFSDIVIGALQGEQQATVLQQWLQAASAAGLQRTKATESEARTIATVLGQALRNGARVDAFGDGAWAQLHEVLADLSRSRAAQGQSAGDTSVFVLALKKPLLDVLQRELSGADATAVASSFWELTQLVDRMAQLTVTTFQKARENIIVRQQEELLELSTPVVKLWEGVLAVPMIGTLDSNRTQVVMETLLQKIVETGSGLAIIDITGVPTVDTLVAQHLLKTVTAIRLMGADCIISGIRPQIAQTIVHLGIDLQGIVTKATLADALALAMQQAGWQITRKA